MQISFTDMEYTHRRKKTRREIFLEKMDERIPWDEWEALVKPYYPSGKRARRPQGIQRMLKMFMLRTWFRLSDVGTEEAVYDSYSMKKFMKLDFFTNEQVPDSSTLYRFRKLLEKHDLDQKFIEESAQLMKKAGIKQAQLNNLR